MLFTSLVWAVNLSKCLANSWSSVFQYGAIIDRGLLPRELEERDSNGTCALGQHSCLDIGEISTDDCCPNNSYCFVTGNWTAACCNLGFSCGSLCKEDEYLCNATVTATDGNVATSTACCERKCSVSTQFACPTQVGGGCCDFGQQCIENADGPLCFNTSTTAPSATVASASSTGCATGDFECGSGCCAGTAFCKSTANLGYLCATYAFTQVVSTVVITVLPTSGTSTPGPASGGGVNGLAVGLGVGLSVGLIAIGVVLFLWVRAHKRRKITMAPDGNREGVKPELDAVYTKKMPGELPPSMLYELQEQTVVSELPEGFDAGPHELPAHDDRPRHMSSGD